MSEERLKIAVFIDFDNIEIGVKSTLNRNFDIAAVLEAVKERGEVVTKVAYGDWKRSGDYGRAMGQHAIHLVQRNLTPGGDKNGADINLALDALEMAFTHDHVNAFVIVGGDSDFMTLVEKLKLYDKKVFVVGGRAFTSAILQKNCHEFIAYENLIRSGRRPRGGARSGGDVSFDKAIPLVLRALKILTDREVSPQIGLLKSTLLQLDSTFTERDYGATSFRDFVEKLARTGVIKIKHMDRSMLVEPGDVDLDDLEQEEAKDSGSARVTGDAAASREAPQSGREELPVSPEKMEEGVQQIRRAIETASAPLKWPMYLRTVRQLLKAFDAEFDEGEYGFRGLQDALRAVQRAGYIRLERNRQGVLRIFPGERLASEATSESPVVTEAVERDSVPQEASDQVAEPQEAAAETKVAPSPEDAGEPEAAQDQAAEDEGAAKTSKTRATKAKKTARTTKTRKKATKAGGARTTTTTSSRTTRTRRAATATKKKAAARSEASETKTSDAPDVSAE